MGKIKTRIERNKEDFIFKRTKNELKYNGNNIFKRIKKNLENEEGYIKPKIQI